MSPQWLTPQRPGNLRAVGSNNVRQMTLTSIILVTQQCSASCGVEVELIDVQGSIKVEYSMVTTQCSLAILSVLTALSLLRMSDTACHNPGEYTLI